MSEKLQLYTSVIQNPDGTQKIVGYAYGEPWVQQALFMDDLRFDTPEAAKEWWERTYPSDVTDIREDLL